MKRKICHGNSSPFKVLKLFSEGQIGYPSGCSDAKGLDQNSIDMISKTMVLNFILDKKSGGRSVLRTVNQLKIQAMKAFGGWKSR